MKTLNTGLYIVLLLGFILLNGCGKTENPTIPEGTKNSDGIESLQKKGGDCIPAPSGLVSWWPGDNNAVDIVSGNDGYLLNGVTFAPGMVDEAFSFDGGDDFVLIPDNNSLDLPGALTIDAWINIRTTGHYNIVLAKRDEANNRNYQLTINPGGTVRFENSNGERDTEDSLTPGLWYHIAATHDGLETVKIYINGALSRTFILAPAPVNEYSLKIGHDCCSFMEGLVDEVEIYNRALTADEIQDIYNAGAIGKCKPSGPSGVPVFNPANGHYYQAVSVPAGITWDDALVGAYARKFHGLQGHLAVITSQEENDFVVNNFPQAFPLGQGGFWLGGFQQLPSTAPDEGWTWITGEPWVFTKWRTGEPNNGPGGEEDALHFHWWNPIIEGYPKGDWNDLARLFTMTGYVVEYEHQVKVTICHKPGTPAQKTMEIPVQALAGHLGHGDKIGSCE